MAASLDTLETVQSATGEGYKYGFVTNIEADEAPPGLNEGTVQFISAKKQEPAWLLEWRLKAFRRWREMEQPNWAKLTIAPIDYQASTYYSAPKKQAGPKSLEEADPELLKTFEKLGVPLGERAAPPWVISMRTRCFTCRRAAFLLRPPARCWSRPSRPLSSKARNWVRRSRRI
jgi:Fe-S cluster assembly protein SufB